MNRQKSVLRMKTQARTFNLNLKKYFQLKSKIKILPGSVQRKIQKERKPETGNRVCQD